MVLSVETRHGVFTLAQMSREPYLFFFDVFSSGRQWDAAALEDAGVLFCVSVTRQFLKQSQPQAHRHVRSVGNLQIPSRWIHVSANQQRRMVAVGRPLERQVWLPERVSLVEKDVMGSRGGPYRHPSGVFDAVLVDSISPDDDAAAAHELTWLWTAPALNERLHLCHRLGRRVSPGVDILLGRDIPEDYADFLDIVAPDKRMEWRWETREREHHLVLRVPEREIWHHWEEKSTAYHQTDLRPPRQETTSCSVEAYLEQGLVSALPADIRQQLDRKIRARR